MIKIGWISFKGMTQNRVIRRAVTVRDMLRGRNCTAVDTAVISITIPDPPRPNKSSFTSHPSRAYESPPWRRSTTAGGPSSLPPCLAALWRRWWSGRVNCSLTGNCHGCRFSFPSMFLLWVGLRQRASSGKIDAHQPMTCLDLSSVKHCVKS